MLGCVPGMTQHRQDAHDFESEWHPQVAFRTFLAPPDSLLTEGHSALPPQWGSPGSLGHRTRLSGSFQATESCVGAPCASPGTPSTRDRL